jgi:lipoprotein-anchoring transpeptidase ErfK/SrfK
MRHGVTAQQLAMANGLHTNSWVYIGQRLKIPGQTGNQPPAGPTSPTPAPTPTVSAPSAPAPSTPTPVPTPTSVPSPPTGGIIYTVRPGDNLIGIAVRHGVSVYQLAAANGLNVNAWVYVGQKLKIPGPGSPSQPAPQPPAPRPQPVGVKWIDVNLSTQTLTAYVGQTPVLVTRVSTGRSPTPTVVGTYRVYSKYPSTHMSGPGYSVPNVPHTMFFFRGYSIHGTYWHNNFGTPMSHGCVNLNLTDAKWLYEWTPMGTKVVTHY